MTIKTGYSYLLGMKNATECISGNEILWNRRDELYYIHLKAAQTYGNTSTIHSWLKDNVDKDDYICYEVFCEINVFFVNEDDLVHFKLRWFNGN